MIGAGVGGLSAAAELKSRGETDFIIIDKCKSLPLNLNNGVHYLHSNNFGTPFPFELKKIAAVEEIWDPRTDVFKKIAHIPEMMEYSLKVMNLRHPSSIMDPGNRDWDTFLPASNNINDLLLEYEKYIGKKNFIWNSEIKIVDTKNHLASISNDKVICYEHMITTAPINSFSKLCEIDTGFEFKSIPIFITNYKTENIVSNWLLGLYISDPQFPPYRITVLNNIISMESVKEMTRSEEEIVKYHLGRYFDYSIDTGQKYIWETGRIFGLTKEQRELMVCKFANENIHLLGRFARWDGKLLLDTTIAQAKMIINNIIK